MAVYSDFFLGVSGQGLSLKDECVLEKLSYHEDYVGRLEFQPCLQPEIMSRDVYFRPKKLSEDARN